jgi:GAF domain-containing protein
MRRGPKPTKGKVEAKLPVVRQSPENEDSRVRGLEKRLEEALREKAEAQEQQAATAEILQAMRRSPADTQPVFDAIVRAAARLLRADGGILTRVAGELIELAAFTSSVPAGDEDLKTGFPVSVHGTGSMQAITVRGRAPFVSTDFGTDERLNEGTRRRLAARGFRSGMAVPLLDKGMSIGALSVTRRDPGAFAPGEIALLQTFADQAVIAIENVRLVKELEARNRDLAETLEQQTATSEILRVISRSPTDVQPVFDTITRNALKLCGASNSLLTTFDGELLHLAALANVGPEQADLLRPRFPQRPDLGAPAGRIISTGAAVHIPDTREDPYFRTLREAGLDVRVRSTLGIPLLRQGEPIGTVHVHRDEPGPFLESQIALLKTFADQAVIAIENVRLFRELEARNLDLTATSEILRVISRSPTDIQPVLDTIAENACHVCGAPDAIVYLVESDRLVRAAHHGPVPITEGGHSLPVERDSVSGLAVMECRTVQVENLAASHEFPRGRAFAERSGFHTVVSVPLVKERAAIGALAVRRTEARSFSPDQIALLETFAAQAVIAIENARLFNETREALEQQRASGEILRVISSSPTDIQPVFDVIVQSAVRLCGGLQSNVYRVEDGLIHLVAHYNFTPEALEHLQRRFPVPVSQGEGLTAHVIREGVPVHLHDAQTDPEVPETTRSVTRALGARSVLYVPMLRDRVGVGVVVVSRAEVKPFSDKEIALIETFADQAVIAIENVRLFKELQASNRDLTTALDQQTATSDLLKVIGRSTFDLQPVFDTLVENAVRLCEAEHGIILRFDGAVMRLVATHNVSPARREFVEGHPIGPGRQSVAGRVAVERRSVQVHDIQADSEYTYPVDESESRPARTVLGVPMLRADELFGVIIIFRFEVRPFTANHIALMETFADQAAIAIENARLLTELQARTQELTRSVGQLTALGEVGQAVSSSLDLGTVLTTIVTRAVQLSGLDGGVVFEYDAGAETFVQRAAIGTANRATGARGGGIRRGEGVVGRTALTLQPVQIADISVAGAYEGRIREDLIAAGVRALVAVPILREGRLIGGLAVNRNQPGEFSPDTVELLRTFAAQSALAIENARLFREIEAKSHELEAASRHKSEFLANMSHELRTPLNAIIGFSEVLAERMFGALNEKQEEYLKDIHASGQHLLSLINDILDLSKIEAGRMELELTDFDLPTAIDNALTLVRERAGRRSIALHTAVDPQLGQVRADERKVRQVVLNLLSNAIKFTPEGGRIEVQAALGEGSVEVSVSDTGVGIAPEDQEAVFEEFRQVGTSSRRVEGTGLGLTLCRKFVELHGGKIRVKSEVGAGSTFTFTLPLPSS